MIRMRPPSYDYSFISSSLLLLLISNGVESSSRYSEKCSSDSDCSTKHSKCTIDFQPLEIRNNEIRIGNSVYQKTCTCNHNFFILLRFDEKKDECVCLARNEELIGGECKPRVDADSNCGHDCLSPYYCDVSGKCVCDIWNEQCGHTNHVSYMLISLIALLFVICIFTRFIKAIQHTSHNTNFEISSIQIDPTSTSNDGFGSAFRSGRTPTPTAPFYAHGHAHHDPPPSYEESMRAKELETVI